MVKAMLQLNLGGKACNNGLLKWRYHHFTNGDDNHGSDKERKPGYKSIHGKADGVKEGSNGHHQKGFVFFKFMGDPELQNNDYDCVYAEESPIAYFLQP